MPGKIGDRIATKTYYGGWWVIVYERQEKEGQVWNTPVSEFRVESEETADRFIKWIR